MALSLRSKRLVLTKLEATPGTAETLLASTDNIPLLRSAEIDVQPISVERPTLRFVQTPYPNIYPGKALCTVTFSAELHASNNFSGEANNSNERPILTRIFQAAGFQPYHETQSLFGMALTGVTTDNGPLRHGESLTETPGAVYSGGKAVCFGDTYADDLILYVDEAAVGGVTGSPTAMTGDISGTVFSTGSRDTDRYFGWVPDSNINRAATQTVEVFADGKKLKAKGCLADIEFAFNHGDAVLVNTTLRGVVVSYADAALPTTISEGHKYPPTFLGSRLTLRRNINVPAATEMYGSAAGGGNNLGAFSQMRLRTGNQIVLPTNAIDPNGVNYAVMTGRDMNGEFDPNEVEINSGSQGFNFFSYLISGAPVRMRCLVIGPDASSFNPATPNTSNNNIFDFGVPGIVFTGHADADRDGLHIWNSSFRIRGTDYDTTNVGEAIGSNSEMFIVHR